MFCQGSSNLQNMYCFREGTAINDKDLYQNIEKYKKDNQISKITIRFRNLLVT